MEAQPNIMGECRVYKCDCGYRKQLMTGAGLGAHSIAVASKSVPAEIMERLCDECGNVRFTLTNSVIVCKACKELGTVTDLNYTFEGKALRYVSDCPVCGKTNKPLKNIEKIKCPKCGKAMSYMISGFWD